MHVGKNQGYRVPGPRDPTGCIEFRASSCTFWLLSLLCPTAISPVSPLSVPFALFFSPASFLLCPLCFFMLGQRRRTENYRRYLDRTRYRFFSASSLHTRAKSDAQTDNQRRENGGPLKLRQAWLTRRSFAQIILYSFRYEENSTCVTVFSEIPENRYRYACEFFFRFEHVNTLTATRVFTEISVRGHACCCARATPIDISVMRVNHFFNKPIFTLLRS